MIIRKLFLMGFGLVASLSLHADKYIVTGNTLNVRNQPSAQGKVIGTIQKDFVIEVQGIDSDFAIIDFIGQKGYVSTKFISKLADTPVTQKDQNIAPQEDLDTSEDQPEKVEKETSISVSQKISAGVSKIKDKIKGSKGDKKDNVNKDDNESVSDGPVSNFTRLKNKKVKFNTVITDDVFGFQSEYEDFKDDNGFTQGMGFRVEEHRDGNTYFYIFQDYSGGGSIAKGSKILIRTADGTVGEIEAVNSGQSQLYKEVEYSGARDYTTIDYSDYRIYYLVPLELMSAIQEYGIVKMRRIYSEGDIKDYVFSGKRYEKANQKSFDMICRICGLHSSRGNMTSYDRWKKNTNPQKKEVPAF